MLTDRDVPLIFEKDIGPTISLACNNGDIIHRTKSAEIIQVD